MLERFDVHSGGFWLALVLAVPLAVIVHELGHAALGALAGYRVVACGVGFRDPFLVIRWGGVRFYLGRPLRMGLTLALPAGLSSPRRQLLFYFSGGILANALSAAAALALWSAGARAGFVAVFGALSAFMALANAVPFRARTGKLVLLSDGRRLLDALRGATGEAEVSPGQRLTSVMALRELCRRLGASAGEVGLTLTVAALRLQLEDVEGAGEALAAPCLADPARDPWTLPLEKVVRALHAVEARAPDAEAALADAEAACPGDPVARVSLQVARVRHAMAAGEPAQALAREALAAARASGRGSLCSAAEALVLEVEPPEDLPAAVRALLARRGPMRLPDLSALRCLSTAARHLVVARAGALEAARPLLHEALALAQRIASGLPEGPARERFLSRAGAPLRDAVAAAEGASVPLFMGAPAGPPPPYRRLRAVATFAVLFALLVVPVVMTWQLQSGQRGTAETQRLLSATRAADDVLALRSLRRGDPRRALWVLERDLDENADDIEPDEEDAGAPPDVQRALAAARRYRKEFPKTGEPADEP
jgi:hypothetical protein